MPVVKAPCFQCKEKHVKCDDEKPKCSRCQAKNLHCERPVKQTVFYHDSSAQQFSKDQKWVSSQARQFQFDSLTQSPVPEPSPTLSPAAIAGSGEQQPQARTPITIQGSISQGSKYASTSPGSSISNTSRTKRRRVSSHQTEPPLLQEPSTEEPRPTWNEPLPPITGALAPAPAVQVPGPELPPIWASSAWNESRPAADPVPPTATPRSADESQSFPLEDVQEACLMSYYIYELAHWLDLADPDRHFQTVVPIRARSQPHLLNAIFAVAARHLNRMPQYRTPQGIMYHGQLLPKLNHHSAVEYTLKCLPALWHFHDAADDDYRDSIVATAVLLRQLEEIDDEHEVPAHDRPAVVSPNTQDQQANFLYVIDVVLRSRPSQLLFRRRSLTQASYWMALRQEIYHSFTRKQAPQMILTAEYWSGASGANKAVMHTVQVVKWRWGDGSIQEWDRLNKQQEYLEHTVLADFLPILNKKADKSKGEIFPTIWYGSPIEVTTVQQAKMAKSVLTAENPGLKAAGADRSAWRKMESDVRTLMLELCGIGLCHSSSPPAILNAAFIIQLYGDFFTDHYERKALKVVIEKYRDINAWPSRELLDMFRD